MATKAKPTPGPWDYVPSTENHGPYVTSEFGSTICDCYTMSNPMALAVCNGGDSKPIHHLHEMADPNARLIAAAPELLAAVRGFLLGSESDEKLAKAVGEDVVREARAALAKAEGRSL